MTPRELSERLALNVEDVCRELLPSGKRVGGEWCCGSVRGEEGKSLKVRLTGHKAGLWADFAAGDKGDLITLYQLSRGVSLGDAIQWAKDYLGIRDDFSITRPRQHRKPVKPPDPSMTPDIEAWFSGRGITRATLDAYKVIGKGTEAAFVAWHGDKAVMVKYRDTAQPKNKAFRCSPDSDPALIGWPAIPDDARQVVITEGEIDAMSYYEQGIPALSVPFGGGGGNKQAWIGTEYERLERFDTIYLSMDMDDAGIEARDLVAERIGFHRCRVIDLPKKDANECHMADIDLAQFVQQARYLDPKELRPASAYAEDVKDAFADTRPESKGVQLPWAKTHNNFRLRRSEVTIWAGINGHGKTTVLSHVMTHAVKFEEKLLIASMEVRPVLTLKRMYQQAGAVELPSPQFADSIAEWIDGFVWLVAIHGTAKAQRLVEIARYAWRRYGITQFVVDSLSKCGMAEDDYNGQKAFVEALGDLAHETGMHVHLVCHSRKGENEFSAPGKMDVKGTGAITDMVDNVMMVWRNKPKEDKVTKLQGSNEKPEELQEALQKPDAIIDCKKQRNHDWEGRIALWFDVPSHQYIEQQSHRPDCYIPATGGVYGQ
jgi:twinkle protein